MKKITCNNFLPNIQKSLLVIYKLFSNLDVSKCRTKYGDLTFEHIFPKLINFFGIGTSNNPSSVVQSNLKGTIDQACEKFQEICFKTDIYKIYSKSFFI